MTHVNTLAKQMMQTLNGKLIFLNSSELDEVKQRIEQIDRKFDRLEMQNASVSALAAGDSIEQIDSLGVSVRKLRTTYGRLFWIVLASSLSLNVANLLVSRHPSCAVEPSKQAIDRTRDVDSLVSGGIR
ncbi:MAG: hypothetical protein D6728_20160 [Cyanobacteria bacterium J055]|nr:MAG: hypothetical protein D6728_20160 [Cyanobacteria bacterium J055]